MRPRAAARRPHGIPRIVQVEADCVLRYASHVARVLRPHRRMLQEFFRPWNDDLMRLLGDFRLPPPSGGADEAGASGESALWSYESL